MKLGSRKGRLIIGLVMVCCIALSMVRNMTGNAAHEWIGVVFLLVLVAHTAVNLRWYRWGRLKHSAQRHPVKLVLNVLLIVAFLGTVVSAVFISEDVLRIEAIAAKGMWVPRVHACFAHWFFLLSGIHLGLYGQRFMSYLALPGRVGQIRYYSPLRSVFLLTVLFVGLYFSYAKEIHLRLIAYYMFGSFDGDSTLVGLTLAYASMFLSYAVVGYGLDAGLKKFMSREPALNQV